MIAIAMSGLDGTERRVRGRRSASGTVLTTDGVRPGLSSAPAAAVLSPVAVSGTSSASGTTATADTGSGAGTESTANTETAAEAPAEAATGATEAAGVKSERAGAGSD